MKYLKIIILFLIVVSCSNDGENGANGNNDGQGGSLAIFALKGNYLYTVDNYNLNIFSLIDGTKPSKVNTIEVGFNIETLFSHGENLYIGSQNGMFIYALDDPENPSRKANVEHFTACDPVVANDTHAFVTLHSNNRCGNTINVLEIYSTDHIETPTLVHRRNLVQPKGLGLYHNYLIVCDDEIKIFDLENPSSPVLVRALEKSCFDVIIKDNTLYGIGANGLYRYTLNPTNIAQVTLESEINF